MSYQYCTVFKTSALQKRLLPQLCGPVYVLVVEYLSHSLVSTIHMEQKNLDKLMAELCLLASGLESKKSRGGKKGHRETGGPSIGVEN